MEQRIFSFGIKEQLLEMLQNVYEVKQRPHPFAAAPSVCVTRPNIMVSLHNVFSSLLKMFENLFLTGCGLVLESSPKQQNGRLRCYKVAQSANKSPILVTL